jgi:hypothetical protein
MIRYLAKKWARSLSYNADALRLWAINQVRRPMTIVVLAMGRSGTSCITRMIHACGASVGEGILDPDSDNPRGYWESMDGIAINDSILRLSGGEWRRPPTTLKTTARIRWRMRRFLARLHRDGTAVWKDPRTALTFPLWKPLLHNYRLVIVFRNPMSVAGSYQKFSKLSISKGLELWCQYAERLLAICDDEPNPVCCINFDMGAAHFREALEPLIAAVGLQFSVDCVASYEATLRTADTQQSISDPRVAALYEELCRRAVTPRGRQPLESHNPPPCPTLAARE